MTSVVRLLPRALGSLPRLAAPLGDHWRRRLLVLAAVAAALAAGYMLWFRDSSLVRVERVEVTGLATAPDSRRIEAELTAAAQRMTTLHLDRAELERVVANDPVVHSLRLAPDFPHGLAIEVVERRPVAVIAGDAGSVPVAADGTLLEGVEVPGGVPEVRTTTSVPSSGRLPSGAALDRVTVAGAAPAPLLGEVGAITIEPEKGYVAHIDGGPAIWLGDGSRLQQKWDAAAAVLAQESSAGASYVDVRVPERAVAGGLMVQSEPQESPADAAPEAPPAVPAEPAPAAPADAAAVAPDPQPSLEP